jgi:molybdate transport system substrate-binding protein
MKRIRFGFSILVVAVLAGCGSLSAVAAQSTKERKAATEIRVLSAVGMREVIKELGPAFEKASGYKLNVSFDSGAVIEKRIAAGEPADVVLLPRAGIDRLTTSNKLISGSTADIATSIVGVAVRKGSLKPDISSAEAFKSAMLNARSIVCPDPALGGSSGTHIAKIFQQLGIADIIKPKLRLVSTPDQVGTMPGYVVAAGEADIALHQMQELMSVPGIEIVGPLPDTLQGRFLFSGGVMNAAGNRKASRSFVEFLRSREAKARIKAKGMDPAFP